MENGVSCLCLTFGRPHLLEEAVESFLRQDWQFAKELLIVNDHPEQRLKFDHPEVSVFNIERRLRTLGEKRNLSVALAKFDNLLIWDDDDIFMPWRISETMKTLPSRHYFRCPFAWIMNDDQLESKPGYEHFHSATGYTRTLFERTGGYRALNGGEDTDFEDRVKRISPIAGEFWDNTILPRSRIFYIYRWRHGSYHTTKCDDLTKIKPLVVKGTVQLVPHWKQDYCALTNKQPDTAVHGLVRR